MILETLVVEAVMDALHKGEGGLGIDFDQPRDLLPKLIESAALFTGRTDELREALADEIQKLAHSLLQKGSRPFRPGDAVRHKVTSVTGRFDRHLGDGYATIWLDGGGEARWPIDEIEAAGESESQALPGGQQGRYPGNPLEHEYAAQAKVAFFSSQEGQRALAKSIKPGHPPSSMGFPKSAKHEVSDEDSRESPRANPHLKVVRYADGSVKSISLV